jgi:methyl-accepting chemotaxis protein/methyl-accepting chemotaxis protein-1 (serine sensor receptor)
MGFAVVADEVRNLAQRCAQAARDTSALIEESIVRSQDGKVRLDEVAACVGKVVENASRIRVLAGDVHVGSQEQARGIEQIAKAVTQMQHVTQTTAASAEETASAGEEMSAQAAALNSAARRLNDLIGAHTVAPDYTRTNSHPETPSTAVSRRPAREPLRDARMEIPLDGDFREF